MWIEQAIALPADRTCLIRELQSVGRIPGALHCPRGLLNLARPAKPVPQTRAQLGQKAIILSRR